MFNSFQKRILEYDYISLLIYSCYNFVISLQMVTRTKKIFVGGLSAPTTLEDVKNYFEQFGPVSNCISFDFTYITSKSINSSYIRN